MAALEVASLESRQVTMSLRRLADEFEMSRDTIAKRLAMHGVQPCGRRHGHPIYRIRDAARALVSTTATDEEGNLDPRTLPPQERNSWFQSEQRRLNVEMSLGQLIPAAEHESDLAQMARDMVQFLVTLPDQLERDCGLTPEMVEAMHRAIDRQRQSLYDQIMQDEDDAAESA